jgi:UDP-GlcNAc:undecaprenyl-phosphate GlcNAc-1-phosphate transferase
VRSFAIKYKLVARPKDNRFHRKVTAILGGVGIFIAVLAGIFFYVSLTKSILAFLAGVSFVFLWGLSDDFRPMRPQVKLLGQIIASCIIIFFDISFNLPNHQLLSYVLTIFWIIGITNAFNLLDNMDGLAAGTAAICSIMIFASSLMLGNNITGVISLILAAAALGFLPYNFNPAKIYMGDSGSMFLGFSLATISIMGSYRLASSIIVTLAIPVFILAVPIFDTLFVLVMRNIKGRSFWIGGKDHTSHRLVSLGLSEKKTVIILYCLSIIFGLIALLYTKLNIIIVSIFAILSIVVLAFFGIFLAEVESYEKKEELEKARKKKISRGNVVLNTVLLYKRNFLEVAVDLVLICVSYYSAYLLKYDARIPYYVFPLISKSLPIIIVIKLLAFFSFGLYSRVWPYMSIHDAISIFKAVTLSSILNVVAVTLFFRFIDYSRAIFILDWLILMFLVIGIRIVIPTLTEYFSSVSAKEKKIIIFGAGNTGEALLREIKRSKNLKYQVLGLVDDDKAKVGRKIRGVSVLGTRDHLAKILKDIKIDTLFVAIPSLLENNLKDIISICADNGVSLRRIERIIELGQPNGNE